MAGEYYVEQIEGGTLNFNIWERYGDRYFNIATLFFKDKMCGTDWSTTQRERAVNYSKEEINDELESPLRDIPSSKVEELLDLSSPEEVAASIEGFFD